MLRQNAAHVELFFQGEESYVGMLLLVTLRVGDRCRRLDLGCVSCDPQ
jgi:hypothetical protein